MSGSDLYTCPPDLTLLRDEELADHIARATHEFDTVHGRDNITPADLQYATSLTDSLDQLRQEQSRREVNAQMAVEQAKDAATRRMSQLAERVHGETPEPRVVQAAGGENVAEIVQAAVRAALEAQGQTGAQVVRRAASLADTRSHVPAPDMPKAVLQTVLSRELPSRHISAGASVPDIEALADAVIDQARSIPATAIGKGAPRYQVASIQNEFAHTVDERTSPAAVEKLIREIASPTRQEALLAGGGWCAPSEIRYDLFNISDQPSGMIDLPTVGISRGGIQFPVSPSIADVFYTSGSSNAATGMGGFAVPFTNASDPWLWTEANDIAAVTGASTKPTLRVPCSSFSTQRLEAYGLTLTAGNLTDSAYPEATQNFLRLLRNAYAHTINARLLSLMQTASTTGQTYGNTNAAAYQTVVNSIELAAMDYRNKYGMADDAVLEVVLPYWVMAVIRADLAWRVYGDSSMLSVSDAQIRGYFADRGVSVQLVSDWQVRASGQFGYSGGMMTAWPTTAKFMIYAAGTFLHGTGLSLDLGVIRDSVLNAENDFSAAWMEEAHLIAKVGHESRLHTVNLTVNGAGTAGLTAAAQI
jgi:hypothetical protein